VIVDVANARELQELGARAIDRTLEIGRRELELRLAPGSYSGVPIELGSTGPALGRLTLRAADVDDPPQFSDLSLRLRAEHVRLEHLVFSATRRELPIIALEGRRVELHRCAVVGCRLDSPPGGRLIELAGPGAAGATATLRDCWFVDDHAPGEGTVLIAAEGYDHVELAGVAFVGNDARVTLAPRAATVRLDRCLATQAADDAVLLATAPDTIATLESCVLGRPTDAGRAIAAAREAALRATLPDPIALASSLGLTFLS
jgi:hypothetical protein